MPPLSALEKRDLAFLEEINQIVGSNLDNALFELYICARCYESNTLHRKIKALTGQPTAPYIRSRRLKKAKQLLLSGELPFDDIALDVGFDDFSHFSRSFIKDFGVKPSAARD